jgi:very-short-patch-repair endonuclease
MQTKRKRSSGDSKRGELLVAIMNDKRDFAILQEQHWYRIPVAKAPKLWPPDWLAFYQTKKFEDDAFAVNYYGSVGNIEIVKRRDLFPNELPSEKSEQEYYRIHLDELKRLDVSIRSARWRRIVFIPTTWVKFQSAAEINDLFDESSLEDYLWSKLKELKISAERQWDVQVGNEHYRLDFAIFCRRGDIDIEVDGDKWHANPERASVDNLRNNALGAQGWTVLRFDEHKIKETLAEYCVPQITATINHLDGLSDEGLVSRKFVNLLQGTAQQLSLFEERASYEAEDDW